MSNGGGGGWRRRGNIVFYAEQYVEKMLNLTNTDE